MYDCLHNIKPYATKLLPDLYVNRSMLLTTADLQPAGQITSSIYIGALVNNNYISLSDYTVLHSSYRLPQHMVKSSSPRKILAIRRRITGKRKRHDITQFPARMCSLKSAWLVSPSV